jgi:hypothetical protein
LETAPAKHSTGGTTRSPLFLSRRTTHLQLQQPVAAVAHGHDQPFWGPADAYLTAGKSIAPPEQNFVDMGIATTAASKTSSITAATAGKGGSDDLSRAIQEEMSKGWKFLDSNTIQIKNLPGQPIQGGYLPGFVDPSSTAFLSQPEVRLYPDYNETPETFVLMIKWAAGLIDVIDKLPLAAFVYALIEFFILRPNLDTTKRQILQRNDNSAMAESVATTSVRLAVFGVVAFVTLVIFG